METQLKKSFAAIFYNLSRSLFLLIFLWKEVRHTIKVLSFKIFNSTFIFKGGYVPGEIITFNVSIDNKNRRAIKYATVSLYQNIKFRANGQNKNEKKEICSVKLDRVVEPRTTEKWHKLKLEIPRNCKPTNSISKIIEMKYELLLKFGSGGFSTPMYCAIPMVIGTVPFDEITQGTFAGFASNTDEPPTYEEALRQVPTAPPEEDNGWLEKFAFWK